ncbi:OLC1v1022532C1 [Oldenlandia corymbosa var. corymbosa]|uniref:OLC1v1022532C1 n=1 Tax=Oldenlandia corymbosa var. corymbosa TaxID=529605 RepID=A0AAV1BYQ0_OLDCO|nr:OLC1v1022532C1 [Oldenlandia corymbosa var. corymbosa]
MDLHLLLHLLTISFILLLLKLGQKFRTKKCYKTSRLPPGPRKLPFIGNLHQVVGRLPHRILADLAKKYGPIMHLQLGEVPTLIVSSPEIAKEIMQTHDINFSTRPPIMVTEIMTYNSTSVSFSPYGDYWRQLRKICTSELLSLSRVQSFRPLREEDTSNLSLWIASNVGSPVNMTRMFHSSIYTTSSRATFGDKSPQLETFIYTINEFVKLASGFNIADAYPSIKLLHVISGMKTKLKHYHKITDGILDNIIKERRKSVAGKSSPDHQGHKDLVDVLLQFHQDQNPEFSLTDDNIKAVLLDVFVAGGGTAAKTLTWAMTELVRHPRVMEKTQQEVREVFSDKGYVDEECLDKLKYLKLVIKETLRLHPPGPLLLPRINKEKCVINGYEIPAKTKVVVNAFAINRHPSHWKDAEVFCPERFIDSSINYKGTNFEYIPFGAGRRMCPGVHFALANMDLTLAKILFHFDWKLPNGMKPEDVDMTENFGLALAKKHDLFLIPVVRNPLPTPA